MHHVPHRRWTSTRFRAQLCVLVALVVGCASPAGASAARLYVAVGDSVGAGFGATPGHSAFDLYCAYLESPAGGTVVDQCINESQPGLTTQTALSGGSMQKALTDIRGSTDTPVVTVVLGGNDLLGTPGCQPVTGPSCPVIHNMRTILDELETALATHPGPHVIQWLMYYNPNHDNPYGNPAADHSTEVLGLGNDLILTACSSFDLSLIGLNDAINCIAQEKGATPVDAYTPFQANCTANDCFSDSVHPNDKGYGLIFNAFRTTPGSPVPTTPAPDGSWPSAPGTPVNTTSPTVTGHPTLGTMLTCSVGVWSGNPPITFTVQWLRDQAPIPVATGSTYRIQRSDVNQAISCAVTASNPVGQTTSTSDSVTVPPGPAPVISGLAETKRVFAPSRAHRARGTVFKLRLDQPAQVTIWIKRLVSGHRIGGVCRPVPRHRHAPRCTLTLLVGALRQRGVSGLNRIPFSGRLNGRALTPGSYVAVFGADNGVMVSKLRTLPFTILGR